MYVYFMSLGGPDQKETCHENSNPKIQAQIQCTAINKIQAGHLIIDKAIHYQCIEWSRYIELGPWDRFTQAHLLIVPIFMPGLKWRLKWRPKS